MVTPLAGQRLAQNSRTNKIARARTSEKVHWSERNGDIREHYKKPLITVIHDLGEPSRSSTEREREGAEVATLVGGPRWVMASATNRKMGPRDLMIAEHFRNAARINLREKSTEINWTRWRCIIFWMRNLDFSRHANLIGRNKSQQLKSIKSVIERNCDINCHISHDAKVIRKSEKHTLKQTGPNKFIRFSNDQ